MAGWTGVDLFFALSGYLITDILLNTVEKPGYLKNFYARRVLRIFPLYYLSLIVFFVLAPGFFSRYADYHTLIENQGWFWSYLQNWYLARTGVQEPDVFLTHFWSLAVEEQFYLLWPLLLLVIRKPRNLYYFLLAGILAMNLLRIYASIAWSSSLSAYTFEYTRCDAILAGALLACWMKFPRERRKGAVAALFAVLVLIHLLYFFLHLSYGVPIDYLPAAGYSLVGIGFAIMVYGCIRNPPSRYKRLLSIPMLRFLGKYSYGIYVVHWPIYVICGRSADSLPGSWFPHRVLFTIFLIGIEIFAAVLIYHLIEKHFLKLKKYF